MNAAIIADRHRRETKDNLKATTLGGLGLEPEVDARREAGSQVDELIPEQTERITELEQRNAELVKERDALWHFSVCPFDHCEKCIADEQLIKSIRDKVDENAKSGGKDL